MKIRKEEFLPRNSRNTRKNIRKISNNNFVLFVLFVVNINFLFAQENVQIEIQPRFVQQFSWTPGDYALYYEIEIEREIEGVYNRFLIERTEESVVHIALPNGNYRFRVIPYDLLNRPGIISEYQYIEIKPASPNESSFFINESKSVKSLGFFGIGVESNAYTRSGFAFGGGLSFGLDIKKVFCAGIKASYFFNLDTVSTLELLLFLRYYLPFSFSHLPFVQTELGGIVFMESGYFENSEAIPSIAGGLSFGWRLNLGNSWFLDPSFRFGYPYMWGGNLSLGVKL